MVRWRADDGTPVAGEVRLQQRRRGGWRTLDRPVTDASGTATVRLRPRSDAVLRVSAPALDWVEATRSRGSASTTSRPSRRCGCPRRPATPPAPPAPGAGRGAGAAPVVTGIPDAVWRGMVGRSWHAGCPVGRDGLRLLRVNYVDFTGYRRRGELVVAAGAVGQFVGRIHRAARPPDPDPLDVPRGPLRLVVTAAGRRRPGLDGLRQHLGVQLPRRGGTPGRAVAALLRPRPRPQPWENPYRVGGSWLPNGWWPSRTHPRVAWRSAAHPVVSILRRHGFSWTYGVSDAHHFDARTTGGRVVARCSRVCH